MVNCTKNHMQEDDGEADDEIVARHESNSYRVGKNSEQKGNTLRAKHSETEQRRRSKINERFQALRDLIPQNDQKRDKASFLLEFLPAGLVVKTRSQCWCHLFFLFPLPIFQALRDLIPQNDQKRDKASFLLEVIEYIQFLNEKLQMYERSYPGSTSL